MTNLFEQHKEQSEALKGFVHYTIALEGAMLALLSVLAEKGLVEPRDVDMKARTLHPFLLRLTDCSTFVRPEVLKEVEQFLGFPYGSVEEKEDDDC